MFRWLRSGAASIFSIFSNGLPISTNSRKRATPHCKYQAAKQTRRWIQIQFCKLCKRVLHQRKIDATASNPTASAAGLRWAPCQCHAKAQQLEAGASNWAGRLANMVPARPCAQGSPAKCNARGDCGIHGSQADFIGILGNHVNS